MCRTKIMAFFLYGCINFISVHSEFIKKISQKFCFYHLFELISSSIVVLNILSILKQKFIIYEGNESINICISDKTSNGSCSTFFLVFAGCSPKLPHTSLQAEDVICTISQHPRMLAEAKKSIPAAGLEPEPAAEDDKKVCASAAEAIEDA